MEIQTLEKQKTEAVPNLRFREFEGKWSGKRLSDWKIKVLDGDRGKNYPSGDDFSAQGFCLFLNAKNVTKTGFSFNERSFITQEKDHILRKGKLQRNDIVLTTRGSVGHIALYDDSVEWENLRINSGMVLLRTPNINIEPQFLYILLISPNLSKQIEIIAFGSAQPQLTVKEINQLNLKFPSLQEQQKIASFISAVDKKIQQLTRKQELLETYKKGVMQQLFSQEIRFKDENEKDFPEWKMRKLKDVCTVNPKNSELPDTFIYIDLESVDSGRLIRENRISAIEAPSRAQRILEENDILFQTVRPYQKNNLFFNRSGKYIASTGYAQLRVNENSMFLYQLLHTEEFVTKVLKRCTGTGYPAINSNDLGKIRIKVPVEKEQNKIADFLSAIDMKIEAVSRQIGKTQSFKKGLLQQMFV